MIKINLLPQNAQKVAGVAGGASGASRGTLLVATTILVMLTLNGLAGWTTFHSVWKAKTGMDQVKGRVELLKDQIGKRMGEADRVRKFHEVVTNQMDVLKTLDPPERMLWCEKLNMLSNLIPADVFISEISVSEQVEMIETEASKATHLKWERADKKKGPEPQPVKRPIISFKMKLTGLALGRDNVEQFNNVMKFHEAMTTYHVLDAKGRDHRFMDGFNSNVDLGSIEATVFEGTPVNQFIFTLTTRTMGAEELNKPAGIEAAEIAAAAKKAPAPSIRRRSREAEAEF